jgi:lysophospholipase L1-like esterase
MRKILLILSFSFLAFTMDDFRPVHVFMVGDSTMSNKQEKHIPENGWGQVLKYFFNDSVQVENQTRNGRSSKSFIDEGLWEKVISGVQEGDYLTAVKQVAQEHKVYFIDIEAKTKALVEEMGPERSKQHYLHFESGIYPLRPEGLNDNTHLSQLGAFTIAGLAVEEMKELDIPLTKHAVNK